MYGALIGGQEGGRVLMAAMGFGKADKRRKKTNAKKTNEKKNAFSAS
jgi:hypothetical protein